MAIQNKTTNYGLPLPQGNEVMAYQDFINEPMQIIDTQMKSNADGVAANKADLVTANQNITEADGKITAIQENLNEWNVPGIINEQNSMDQRLTAVEETTMEFVHPDVGLKVTGAYDGSAAFTVRSGGLIFFSKQRIKTDDTLTLNAVLNYISGNPAGTPNPEVCKLGSMPGNILNLAINLHYWLNNVAVTYKPSDNVNYIMESLGLYASYNGSETELYIDATSINGTVAWIIGWNPVPLGLL